MSAEEKERQQVISIAKKEFDENQATVKELIDLVKGALSENAEIKKRVMKLESRVEKI